MEQTMDRRTQARQRRKVERRRWKLLRFLLAAAAIFLAMNILFEISDIQVAGNVIYSEAEVLEASGLRPGRSALTVSGFVTAKRIHKALPGISDARVSLTLPDMLTITVSETPAIAVLETAAGSVPVSGDCQVVNGFRGNEAELIRVRGLEPESADVGATITVRDGDSTKLTYLQELLPLLEQTGLMPEVEEIDVSNVSSLTFTYQGRFTVRLGGQENLAGKLDLLQRVVSALGAGDAGILDLSTEQEGHYIPG